MPAPEPVIRLRSVLKSRRNSWLLALLLGAITLLCAITLLALSGWFISAAALAGLAGTAAYGFDETLGLIKRPFSRSQSFFFSVSRLSCSALPLAKAISHLTLPLFQCKLMGTRV